jgi:hypothetical protein
MILGREAYFHELVQTVLDWDYATDAAVQAMHEQIKAGTHAEAYYAHMWETRLSVRVAFDCVMLFYLMGFTGNRRKPNMY